MKGPTSTQRGRIDQAFFDARWRCRPRTEAPSWAHSSPSSATPSCWWPAWLRTGWTLVLGFTISAVLHSVVSGDQMKRAFGRGGPKEMALVGVAGAASLSCSYASAAIMPIMFKKGAALVTSLALLTASTNLVLEREIILFILLARASTGLAARKRRKAATSAARQSER